MTPTKHIPVSGEVWASLSELKGPGQTFDELLAEIILHEKERRFLTEMAAIEAEGDFVEFVP
jgi:predicted CopG family antitoxin